VACSRLDISGLLPAMMKRT